MSMKYLNSYKIFESHPIKNQPAFYLEKMGCSYTDVKEIFLPLTDLGYELKMFVQYKDENGRVRSEKSTRKETPYLKIKFKAYEGNVLKVGGSTKFESLDYIEAIYHTLSRFTSMYKDKVVDMTYSLDTRAEMAISCQFESEYDEYRIEVSRGDLISVMEETLSYLNDYDFNHNKDYNGDYYYVTMDDELLTNVINNYVDEMRESEKDDNYRCNYKEIDKKCDDIRTDYINRLSRHLGEDLRYIEHNHSDGGIYHYKDGKKGYQIASLRVQDHYDSKRWRHRIKTGFMRKKDIEIEIYNKIEIKVSLK